VKKYYKNPIKVLRRFYIMAKKVVNNNLNAEMIENIDNYAERINTIEDFVKVVRQSPGYQCGAIGNHGFLNLIREIAQNSIDQVADPSSPGTWVSLMYDENTLIVTCEDNGLGIPFNDMVRIFTKENTSKNYKKKPFEYSSGLHGVGAKVTNALSEWFTVESYRYDGEARRLDMVDGYPKGKPYKIPNPDMKQGTKVSFKPHTGVLGELDLSYEIVLNLIRIIVSLTPIGTKLEFTAIPKKGKPYHEVLENKDGIITDLIMKTKDPLCAPIVYGEDTGIMKCDFAFVYDTGALTDGSNITAFSNFCPTEAGTHIDGFDLGVCRWFQNYMNKIFLGSKSKVQVKYEDVRTGLNVMLSTAHLEPIFDGQSKSKLSNAEMKPFVADVVQRGLDKWSKEKPNDLNRVAGYLKQVAQVRLKAEEGKIKLAKSYTKSAITGLPDKYVKPTGDKDLELWIVEGDSAGGTAKSARVNACQGVFPIRGKIPNAFEKSKADILSNVECRGILDIIGGGDPGKNWGKDFDITRVKWKKIVGCPDADVDGSHINALILRLLILYATPILENGLYYKAVSPLYSVKNGKKYTYFVDRIDMLKHFQRQFTAHNKITTPDGTPLSSTKLTAILLEFADYTWEVNRIARTYKVDPYMLEKTLMLHKAGKGAKAIAKEVKKDYQYVSGSTILGTPTIEGLIGTKYNTIFLNDKFLNESKTILDFMDTNTPMIYIMNGKPTGMYGLMTEFDKLMNGSTLSRYKGLGELQTQQFRESVMDPQYNRTFIQYTLDSAMEEIEAIRAYESNKAKILDHVGSVSRLDLME
jgi:DNA gyrase subunit B